ncbi:MAG TPA: hypothetical protein VJM46_00570 [Candidatus Saccharimonadales bacterium]|nr:hypothetical protein [Candidatus Saccharimonadales bacterium]
MTQQILRDIATSLLTLLVLYLNVRRANKRVVVALIVPVALMLLHGVGNTMQEQGAGPELVRNGLHDLGIAAYALTVSFLVAPLLMPKRDYGANAIKRARETDQTMAAVLLCSTLGTIACISYVVMAHTSVGKDMPIFQHAEAAGWSNAVGYAIAGGIMVLNHIYSRRWVLKLPQGASKTQS